MGWEPGNPKGWGDPAPIVLMVLLLALLGSAVGNYDNYTAEQQRCQQILNRGNTGQ